MRQGIHGPGTRAGVQTETADRLRLGPMLFRQALPLLLLALTAWAAHRHIHTLEPGDIWQVLMQAPAWKWAVALLATAGSFAAVGRYDQLVHAMLGTGVAQRRARDAGLRAIAVSQFTGFGVLTSALVRWHQLDELSLPQALRLSVTVAATFIAGWGIVTAGAVLVLGPDHGAIRALAWLVVAGVGLAVVARARICNGTEAGTAGAGTSRLLEVLDLPVLARICALVLVDCGLAALAFWMLLPAGTGITAPQMFAAFLLACGAGLIGGTPVGLGPFDAVLLALLPAVADERLLGTALAFRLVYYLVPALLATGSLLGGGRAAPPRSGVAGRAGTAGTAGTTTATAGTATGTAGARQFRGSGASRLANRPGAEATAAHLEPPAASARLSPRHEHLLWFCPSAEANLIRQGRFSLLRDETGARAVAAPAGPALVMLGGPLRRARGERRETLLCLRHAARRRMRSALVYKADARTALAARALAWKVLHISDEAWLEPARFSTDGPQRRQLRRALRKAERAGLRVTEGGQDLPLRAMARIARQWAEAHGGERAFSMGRFSADYVSCQRVFLAWKGARLVAFATFHENRSEWVLDLMRHGPQAPDGTMHLLVCRAIAAAAAAFCPRLSLAAAPARASTPPGRRLSQACVRRIAAGDGLRRFKASFAPRWQPLYACAPGRAALILGLAGVAWNIHFARKRARRRAGRAPPGRTGRRPVRR